MNKILRQLPNAIFLLIFTLSSFTAAPHMSGSASIITSPPENPSQAQAIQTPVVARVYFTNQDDLAGLANRLDILEVHRNPDYAVILLSPGELQTLIQSGYRVEIDTEKTALVNQPLQPLPGQTQGIPGYPCYRTVEETYSSMQNLVIAHPNLATLVDIGDSWDKMNPGGPPGYDLYAIVLTNHAIPGPKPVFFLMAEIHARELTTSETAMRFAEYLVNQYGVHADITWLLDYFEIHVVPMTNPDGRKFAETGVWWRKNTDNDDGCTIYPDYGTDLNRNHSFHWNQGGSSGFACDETYHGPSSASEPEVQAIQNYILTLFADQRGPGDEDPAPMDTTGEMISLHSYSNLVLWPYGFRTQPAPNNTQLQTLGRKFAFFNGYTPEQAVGLYPTSGTSDDWAYGTLGIAAYTFEMGNNFFESCGFYENTIYKNNLKALIYAAKAARRPYINPAGPDSLNLNLPTGVVAGSYANLSATANDTRYAAGEPSQNISAAHFTLDAPSWQPGAISYSMNPTDGMFNSPIENIQAAINTVGLSLGRYQVFVESQDSAGNWGVPTAASFCVASVAHGAGVDPSATSGQALPGQDVTYNIQITNLGVITDSFNLSMTGNNWPVTAPASLGPIGACDNPQSFNVVVHIPNSAFGGSTDALTLTVTSQADPGQFASINLTTTAMRTFGLALSPEVVLRGGNPGDVITYTLQVMNTGNYTDSFLVETSGNSWPVSVPSIIGPLSNLASEDLNVMVTIPITAPASARDTLHVTVSSIGAGPGNPYVSTSLLTTYASRFYNLSLLADPDSKIGFPDTTVTYSIQITNTGNIPDIYHLEILTTTWTATLSQNTLNLDPGQSDTINLNVELPPDVTSGLTSTTTLTVMSQGNPALKKQITLTSKVGWRAFLALLY